MHARLSTYAGPVEGFDEMMQGFDKVSAELRQLDGFEGAYVLVDRNSGKAATITLWRSEQAAQGSAKKADEMRTSTAQAGGYSIESVETFEVALRVEAD